MKGGNEGTSKNGNNYAAGLCHATGNIASDTALCAAAAQGSQSSSYASDSYGKCCFQEEKIICC